MKEQVKQAFGEIQKDYRKYLEEKVSEYKDIIEGLELKGKTGTAMTYGIWLKAYEDALDTWDEKVGKVIGEIEMDEYRMEEARCESNSIRIAQAEYNKEKHR